MLKNFAQSIEPVFEALTGVRSELLMMIRDHCRPAIISPTLQLIREVINDDVTYQKTPLDLRNQRTYAVKVARKISCLVHATSDIVIVWRQRPP